jgi:LmbE family N-acetylglucosaminyl deacetylase/tetratricopeptide (TPR) repeat protein
MLTIFATAYLLQATYLNSYNKGHALLEQGMPREAEVVLESSISENPGYVPALMDLAEAHVKLRHFHDAVEAYRRIIEIKPSDVAARGRLAELYSWAGDYDKAIVTYRDAIEIDPGNNGLKTGLAQVFRWYNRYDEAGKLYGVVIRSDPENREALKGLAKTYSMTGELPKAVQLLEKAQRLYPQDAELYKDMGTVLAWQQDYKNSIEWLKKAVSLAPDYAEAYRTLGDVYSWTRSYKPAVESYKKAIEIEPNNAENHALLARAYRSSGNRHMAEEAVKDALKIEPANAAALEVLRDIRTEPNYPLIKDAAEAFELVSFVIAFIVILAISRSRRRILRRRHKAFFYVVNFIMPTLVMASFVSYIGKNSFAERLNMSFMEELTEGFLLLTLCLASGMFLWTQRKVKGLDKKVILAIGAHPDDIELGCGGFIMKAKDSGASVYGLTMTRGEKGSGGRGDREEEQKKATGFMELDGFWMTDFQDTRLNLSVSSMKELIEEKIRDIGVNMVLTHSAIDIHTDHQAVFEATKAAARNVSVLCYEDVSTPKEFVPNYFVDISWYVEDKLKMLAFHRTQKDKLYMDPEAVRGRAAHRGIQGGMQYAEAFSIYRLLR